MNRLITRREAGNLVPVASLLGACSSRTSRKVGILGGHELAAEFTDSGFQLDRTAEATSADYSGGACCESNVRLSKDRSKLIYFKIYPPAEYLLSDLQAPSGSRSAVRGRFKDNSWIDSEPVRLIRSEPLAVTTADERTEILKEFDVRWFGLESSVKSAGEISIRGRTIRLSSIILNSIAFSPNKEFVAIISNTSGGSGVLRAVPNYKSIQMYRLSDLTEIFSFNFGGDYGEGSIVYGWLPNSLYTFVSGVRDIRIQIIRPR